MLDYNNAKLHREYTVEYIKTLNVINSPPLKKPDANWVKNIFEIMQDDENL